MDTQLPFVADGSGTLESFAWPGGYSILYTMADAELMCSDCANGRNGSKADFTDHTEPQWRIVGCVVHWEGPPETCCHCGKELPSEYGDPEAETSQ